METIIDLLKFFKQYVTDDVECMNVVVDRAELFEADEITIRIVCKNDKVFEMDHYIGEGDGPYYRIHMRINGKFYPIKTSHNYGYEYKDGNCLIDNGPIYFNK